jgi:hypothetical protein
MTEPSQIEGAYAQGRYGFALGTMNGGDLCLKNNDRDTLHLKAKHTGLILSLVSDAVVISLKQVTRERSHAGGVACRLDVGPSTHCADDDDPCRGCHWIGGCLYRHEVLFSHVGDWGSRALEASNDVLLFGISTAFLFAVAMELRGVPADARKTVHSTLENQQDSREMTSLEIALLIFVSVFGGAMAGVLLQRYLPADHRDADSKDVVKLVMSLLSTALCVRPVDGTNTPRPSVVSVC